MKKVFILLIVILLNVEAKSETLSDSLLTAKTFTFIGYLQNSEWKKPIQMFDSTMKSVFPPEKRASGK